MTFMRQHYGKKYAPNTRENIRRQTLHQFEQARIVDRNPDDPSRPTNSGKNAYALTPEIVPVLRAYGSRSFRRRVTGFVERFGSLAQAYADVRAKHRVPLRDVGGCTFYLSPGKHNELQVAVIEEFGPRFAPGAEVLHMGDTARKQLILEVARLRALRIATTEHDKLPDIVLHWPEKNWLFVIEAVTSHGPVSPKRHRELERMLARCTAERVYVTAFLDMRGFRKHAGDIAWETEVWIAERPDHMIHFNGPRFLGPYGPRD